MRQPGTLVGWWVCVVVGVSAAGLGAAAESSKLSIVRTVLHQYQDGPPVASGFEFLPGDTVFLSFRVAGYHVTREDKIHLKWVIDALDPSGLRLKEPVSGELATEVTPEDRKNNWMPIVRYEVLVPPAAPSGEYGIRLKVDDKLGETSAESEVKFRVRGREVPPSDTLVVRNFRFLRSETSTQPLEVAAYRPGDSVWARFDITGYKFAEKNRFSIDYGIKVLRASGAVLFEQPVAAEEERESFYPERHIAGSLSLNLTPDLSKGEYTIVVTVHDRIGGQNFETRQTFLVE